jgi:TetR/AcrR family transcriptional repressor of nem operon
MPLNKQDKRLVYVGVTMIKETKGQITRQKIIDAAASVVVSRGFNNTSINDIIQASGVKKGSVYFHFPGKEEIGIAILEDARNNFREFMVQSAVGETPEEKISNYLDAVMQHQRESCFVGGCLFGNTALEMSDLNPRFLRITQEFF